jgi:hypothetical protein
MVQGQISAELLKRISFILAAVAVTGIAIFFIWSNRGVHPLRFDTPYQAVLLDNGQVYYAKFNQLDSDFSVLTDVFYVERQVDAQTKEVKNILIRRGNEWHAPNRTVISSRHILMIEPVSPGSKVAELIAALKKKD